MALRFATNSIARFSSVVSMDWDNVTGKPDFSISEHSVAIGDGDGGFRGVAPGAIGTVLSSAGPAADPIFTSLPYYPVSLYDSLQAACDAAATAEGGTVLVDEDVNLGSGAVGLDLDSIVVPIRLTGPDGPNGGTGQSVMITYSGTGVMVSAVGNYGLDVSHLYFRASGAGSTMFDLDDSAYTNIHDNVLVHQTSNSSNIGITLNNTQRATVERNTIAISGGTGIRGVAPAGTFSVKALINNNVFTAANDVCIEGPGQVWTISNNIAQNPVTNFIKAGPSTSCDVLNVFGNDIDDIVGNKTLITSNAGTLNLKGNRFGYSSGTVTCVSQTNSTGTVNSDGDRLSGTVGIAIGTGNYLFIRAHVGDLLASWAPTTLYTGTPATSVLVEVIGGITRTTGRAEFGDDGVAGELRIYNGTSNTNYGTIIMPTGVIGTCGYTMPNQSTTIVGRNSTDTLTNKTMSGASNTFTNIPISTAISGLGTGIAAALAVNTGSAGAPVLFNGALGTPSSGTVTNLTGTASININGTVGATTPNTGVFTTIDSPIIRASGTLLNANGGTGSTTVTLLLTGGSGANGGSTIQLAKNTNGNVTHYYGHSSAIFGGGSTSSDVVLYNAGVSGGLAGRVYTASHADNSVAFASTVDGTSGTAGAINTLGGIGATKAIWAGQSIKSAGATHGIGYATGAGGTVTQITSRTTGVTINKVCGQITLFNAAGSTSYTTFTVTNSAVAATDNVVVNCSSGTNVYLCHVTAIAAGSFNVTFNTTGGTSSDSPVFNFSVIKGVSS